MRITLRPYLATAALSLAVAAAPGWAAEEEETANDPASSQGEPPPAAVEHVTLDPEQLRFNALARQAPLRQLVFLPGAAQEFIALYQPDNSGDPKGAALILHGEESHPDWPQVVGPLRRYLPDHGWATLAIALPSPGAPDIPERTLPTRDQLLTELTSTPEQNGTAETETEEAPAENPLTEEAEASQTEEAGATQGIDPFTDNAAPDAPANEPARPLAERINQRIQAGIDYLRQQGHSLIVLLGHDVGAAWAAQFAATPDAPTDTPLVLISPRLPQRAIELDLLELMSQQERPVLDLYFARNEATRRFAKQRRDAMRRNNREQYRQTRLAGYRLTRRTEDRRIVQNVRGWLQTVLEAREQATATTAQATAGEPRSGLPAAQNTL